MGDNPSLSGTTGRVKEFVRSERGSSKPAPKNSSTSKQESSAKKGGNKATTVAASAQGSKHTASATSHVSGKSSTAQSSGKSSAASKASSSAAASAAGSKVGGSGKGSANSALAQGAAVGTATTMGSVKPIIGKDKYVKTPKEAAAELSKKINKNSIIFETASKIGHIDLTGRSHFDKKTGRDIETPHIHVYDKNINPITGKAHPNKKTEIVLPATHNDIRVSRKLAKQKGLTNE